MKTLKHLAMIMDGNRRFSKRLMLEPWKGHEHGAEKIKKVMEWSKEQGITMLTLYAFSYENFHRSKREFTYLMKLFQKEADQLLSRSDELCDQGICIRFVGRLYMLPSKLQHCMKQIMKSTEKNKKFTVNFALAYSGRLDIIDAANKLISKGRKSLTQENLMKALSISSEPDLIIRTGGEHRLSNFLTYQSAYSELSFTKTLWPDLTKKEFNSLINKYYERERRFGR